MPEIDKAKAMGSPTAPVTMEVFASFDCPHCKDLHETTMPMIVRDYVVPRQGVSGEPGVPAVRPVSSLTRGRRRFTRRPPAGSVSTNRLPRRFSGTQAAWAVNGEVWSYVAPALTPADQKKVQLLVKDPGVVAEVRARVSGGRGGRSQRHSDGDRDAGREALSDSSPAVALRLPQISARRDGEMRLLALAIAAIVVVRRRGARTSTRARSWVRRPRPSASTCTATSPARPARIFTSRRCR